MNHEVTLTRAELAAIFKPAQPDTEPLTGPLRMALEIEDVGDAFVFTERDRDTGVEVAVETMRKDNH